MKKRTNLSAGKCSKTTEAMDFVIVKHKSKVQSVFSMQRGAQMKHGVHVSQADVVKTCPILLNPLIIPAEYNL